MSQTVIVKAHQRSMTPKPVIVMDNSINSRLLWPDSQKPENNEYALSVIQQAINGSTFYVPSIWHYEAAQVAASLTRKKLVSRASSQSYFNQLALLPIKTDILSHAQSMSASYGLSLEYGLSPELSPRIIYKTH